MSGLLEQAIAAVDLGDPKTAIRLLTEYVVAEGADRPRAERLLDGLRRATDENAVRQTLVELPPRQYAALLRGETPPAADWANTDILRPLWRSMAARSRTAAIAARDERMQKRLAGAEDGDVLVFDTASRATTKGQVRGGKREGVWLEDGKFGPYENGRKKGSWFVGSPRQFAVQQFLDGRSDGAVNRFDLDGYGLSLRSEVGGWQLEMTNSRSPEFRPTGDGDNNKQKQLEHIRTCTADNLYDPVLSGLSAQVAAVVAARDELGAEAVALVGAGTFDDIWQPVDAAARRVGREHYADARRRMDGAGATQGADAGRPGGPDQSAAARKAASDLAVRRLDRFRQTIDLTTAEGRSYELTFNLLTQLNALKQKNRLTRQAMYDAFATGEASGMYRSHPDKLIDIGGAWMPSGDGLTLREVYAEAVSLIPGR